MGQHPGLQAANPSHDTSANSAGTAQDYEQLLVRNDCIDLAKAVELFGAGHEFTKLCASTALCGFYFFLKKHGRSRLLFDVLNGCFNFEFISIHINPNCSFLNNPNIHNYPILSQLFVFLIVYFQLFSNVFNPHCSQGQSP